MSQKEKILSKIVKNPRNVSLDDFESLIKVYGYIEEGNHPKAILREYTLPYKRENPVKVCYVKEVISIINMLEGFL
jgi:hypothetical protein